jgi:FMN-dependent NADH-azoreductase
MSMFLHSTRILKIDSSARIRNSYSRILTNKLADQLSLLYPNIIVKDRNISNDLPFLSEIIIEAMFMPDEKRTSEQKQALKLSDEMINELKQSDILIIGLPVYNFNIPASLKAYIDLITRAGLTFRYTEDGPTGLVENIKAYIVITSGGTALYSDMDFASDYIKFILSFIGIKEIYFIDATQLTTKGADEIVSRAMGKIELLICTD